MADRSIFLLLILVCFLFRNPCHSERDTLQQGQELKDWDELVSSNKVFNLKLFSFGAMVSPYLGIFYKNNNITYRRPLIYRNKAVWVANRNNPIPDMYGKLIIDVHGKFSILSSGGTVLDLFSPNPLAACNASAKLLDTGNLVLQELHPDGSVKRVLWQSFDHPTETLLPGMKLGINLKTGHRWSLTSWEGETLPVRGSFTLTVIEDLNGTAQMVILKGENIDTMSGPWANGELINPNKISYGSNFRVYYVSNKTEQYFTYLTKSYDSFPALRMSESGELEDTTLHTCLFSGFTRSPGAQTKLEMFKCRDDYTFYMGTGCKTYGKMLYNPAEAYQDKEYYTFRDRG
ncbi:putative non-specific serine/threonine protein kinase [Helianthus annuus]|nr:putative non-specific serine/threonine protein kinase [Helianthus annuus]